MDDPDGAADDLDLDAISVQAITNAGSLGIDPYRVGTALGVPRSVVDALLERDGAATPPRP